MDLGVSIEVLLKGVGAKNLTNGFVSLLLFLFIVSMICWFRDNWRNFTNYTPSLLTSIGILGTFAGIITGLLEFDPRVLDESIGPLLEGLKTAFISSLAGLFLSILYRIITTVFSSARRGKQTGAMSAQDIFHATATQTDILKEQTQSISEQSKDIHRILNAIASDKDFSILSRLQGIHDNLYSLQRQIIDELHQQNISTNKLVNAINTDAETSLSEQLKLLRTDFSGLQKPLIQSIELQDAHWQSLLSDTNQVCKMLDEHKNTFDIFTDSCNKKLDLANESLSKSPTEHVIESLKEVTREFNTIIIEQFGDNFKQLNQAVGQLLTWQENYREQLEDMNEQYRISVTTLEKSEQAVSSISHSTEIIPQHMQSLHQVLQSNQAQIEELHRHLKAFEDIKENAVNALPEIENLIKKLVKDLDSSGSSFVDVIGKSSTTMSQAINESAENYKTSTKISSQQLTRVGEDLKQTAEAMESKSHDTLENMNKFGTVLVNQANRAREEVEKGLKVSFERLLEEIEMSAVQHAKKASQIHEGLEQTVEQTMNKTAEAVSGTIETEINVIANARNQEVERVMHQMGEALVTITATFTDDYRKLVTAMAEIVNQRN